MFLHLCISLYYYCVENWEDLSLSLQCMGDVLFEDLNDIPEKNISTVF